MGRILSFLKPDSGSDLATCVVVAEQLFALAKDPEEQVNLASVEPEVAAEMGAELRIFLDRCVHVATEQIGEAVQLDEHERSAQVAGLRALRPCEARLGTSGFNGLNAIVFAAPARNRSGYRRRASAGKASAGSSRLAGTIGVKWKAFPMQQVHLSVGRSVRTGAEGVPPELTDSRRW